MARSTCATCKRVFGGTSGFDTRRVGDYEQRDRKGRLLQPSTRHCMTDAEIIQTGMLLQNGIWIRAYNGPLGDPADDDEIDLPDAG